MPGFIEEDPDDVGYIWNTGNRRRNESPGGGNSKWDIPAHGGFPEGFLADVRVPRSLTVCHMILPPKEQTAIVNAAFIAEKMKKRTWAEQQRAHANYDNLDSRPDADCASGTI